MLQMVLLVLVGVLFPFIPIYFLFRYPVGSKGWWVCLVGLTPAVGLTIASVREWRKSRSRQ